MAEKKLPKRIGGYGEMNNPGLLSFAPGLQGFPQSEVTDRIPSNLYSGEQGMPNYAGREQLELQNMAYERPQGLSLRNNNSLTQPNMLLDMPQGENAMYLRNRVGEGSGASDQQRNREIEEYMNLQGTQMADEQSKLGLEDTRSLAAMGGINAADALGQGARDTGKYGMNLLNAALYGKDSDRTLGQDLKKGGGFLQKLLFGSKPTPEAQGQVASNNFQMTPEQQTMRDKGIADNPWLTNEDSENWWEMQDYEPTTPGGNVSTRKLNRPTSYYGIGTN